ncbi:MAG: hypothetical protein LBU32_00695 [Clostridiales bacterium]|nr:hypothetical protein [Clostridiales bacterium]
MKIARIAIISPVLRTPEYVSHNSSGFSSFISMGLFVLLRLFSFSSPLVFSLKGGRAGSTMRGVAHRKIVPCRRRRTAKQRHAWGMQPSKNPEVPDFFGDENLQGSLRCPRRSYAAAPPPSSSHSIQLA